MRSVPDAQPPRPPRARSYVGRRVVAAPRAGPGGQQGVHPRRVHQRSHDGRRPPRRAGARTRGGGVAGSGAPRFVRPRSLPRGWRCRRALGVRAADRGGGDVHFCCTLGASGGGRRALTRPPTPPPARAALPARAAHVRDSRGAQPPLPLSATAAENTRPAPRATAADGARALAATAQPTAHARTARAPPPQLPNRKAVFGVATVGMIVAGLGLPVRAARAPPRLPRAAALRPALANAPRHERRRPGRRRRPSAALVRRRLPATPSPRRSSPSASASTSPSERGLGDRHAATLFIFLAHATRAASTPAAVPAAARGACG